MQIGDIADKNQKFVLKYIQSCINVLLELIKVSNVLIMLLLCSSTTINLLPYLDKEMQLFVLHWDARHGSMASQSSGCASTLQKETELHQSQASLSYSLMTDNYQ